MNVKYSIKYERGSIKYLKKLDKGIQIRIISAINKLPHGDVKRLQGCSALFRLRVGGYRIIFSRDEEYLGINVIEIASRGEVYKRK